MNRCKESFEALQGESTILTKSPNKKVVSFLILRYSKLLALFLK